MAIASERRRPWLSLRTRVILVTIGLQVIFIVAFGGIQIYTEYHSMRDFVRDSSVTYAGCIAHSSAQALSSRDHAMLGKSLMMAQRQHGKDIKYVLLQDRGGRVLASTFGGLAGSALHDSISRRAMASVRPLIQDTADGAAGHDLYGQCAFDVSVPIFDGGTRVATVRMGVSSQGIHRRVRDVVWRVLWMAGLALIAGGLLAVAVDRKMQGSLHELGRVTRSIADGDLSQRVQIDTGDELQELGATFNQMTEQLEASRGQLKRWGEDLEEKVRLRTIELEAERQKLDGVVSGIGAGLVLLDRKLRVMWANNTASRWLGPLSSLVGAPCLEARAGAGERCKDCAAARALASGQIEQSETISQVPGGQRRFLQVTASPIRDERGDLIQVVELIQDVTERRRMEQQLTQASKMVAIGELAAAVAHEINNPLAVIGASVERLQFLMKTVAANGPLEKFPTYLETVGRHVYRCKETIDKLLGFARHKEPGLTITNLNQVLLEAVGLIRSRAAFAGVALRTELSAHLPAIETDPHELVQVFVNLLTNALDACGESGEISVSSRLQADELLVEVADSGSGIAPEHLAAIFEPFFTTKPEGKGTGLGLPICRRIVNQLGGRLAVSSARGVGTTFSVALPLARPAARAQA